jgi:inner membrane protein
MHLPSHLALSWLVGHRLPRRRDRVLVAWAGVYPDLDALTALGGIDLYGQWHHVLTHGAVACAALATLVAVWTRDARVVALAVVAFHLHLVCDLLGSGQAWPIVYLYPLSGYEYFTPYGWPLASWQNVSITAAALLAIGAVAVRRGVSFAEAFLPGRAADAVVEALRQRFGPPQGALEPE